MAIRIYHNPGMALTAQSRYVDSTIQACLPSPPAPGPCGVDGYTRNNYPPDSCGGNYPASLKLVVCTNKYPDPKRISRPPIPALTGYSDICLVAQSLENAGLRIDPTLVVRVL